MINMRIAGRGTVPAGEYDKVSLSGSGRLFGEVRCNNFSASGASKGESITCAERFKVSGASSFSGQVKAKNVRTAGSFSCGTLVAEEQLSASGSLRVGGDLQAASVHIAGGLECNGTLCAKETELQADKEMRLERITGGNVRTRRKLISIFRKRRVSVTTAIEGDALDLEYATAPRVTGQSVIIGKGCEIDLVQYRDELQISPKATVGKVEKF